MSLITINTFNLLPLAGLDGARLLQHVLFSRHRWLELGFQGCAAAAAGFLAVRWQTVALGILAYLMIIILPYRSRLLKAAAQIRATNPSLPVDPAELDGEAGHAIFFAARQVVTERHRGRVGTVAAAMEQILDAAVARRPSWHESLLLGFALFFSFVLGLAALVLLVRKHAG